MQVSEQVTGIAVFVGFVLLIVGISVLAWRAERRRKEAWRTVASQLGLQVIGESTGLAGEFVEFKLFQHGRSRKASNLLRGDFQGAKVWLGDYQYTTGSGKNRTTHNQTFCLLEAGKLDVPHFFLRRQLPFFDFLGKAFGGQDINFPEDPDFSKAFVLQSMDEGAARTLFGKATLRRHLLGRYASSATQIEGNGTRLLLHHGRRTDPAQARDMLVETLTLVSQLVA